MSFATLEQLKRWLTIDPSRAADDDLLQMLLNSATSSVCTYCSRAFEQKEYTDMIHSPLNGRYLPLEQYPISTVTTLKINGKEITKSTANDVFGYMNDAYGIRLIGYTFARHDLIEVVYTAGYAVLPDDIVHCVLEIAGLNYREKDRIGMTSKGIDQQTTSFNHAIPAEVKSILNQYRRVRSMR
jgi:hypothetical protein